MTKFSEMDSTEKALAVLIIIFIVIPIFIGLYFLWLVLIKWAWNITMPAIFHLPTINTLQAFALTIVLGLVGKTIYSHKK